ncbi:MAG: hypothetical protein Tsb005_02080 [Gammaproteobacteria bacterium]
MSLTALQAAAILGQATDWRVTNLQIQKILYLSHMFYMGRANNIAQPLLDEAFEAWDYGPVIPSLYHKLKPFGASPIPASFLKQYLPSQQVTDDQLSMVNIIKELSDKLTQFTPGQLVAITHKEQGAWDKHYNSARKGIKIDNQAILQEYKDINGDTY